jgi:hypothetical protein
MDLAYDPEQDPEERRRVRRDYRDLAKETESQPPSQTKNSRILMGPQMSTPPNTLRLTYLEGWIEQTTSSAKVQTTGQ